MADPQPLCGITHDYRGTTYPPCTRTAGHIEAYCHTADGRHFLAHPDDETARTAAREPLTTQQLDEITARANAATPGPWTSEQELGSPIVHVDQPSPKDGTFSVLWTAEWATEADGVFTAHAREDVPALLADNQHLRQQLAALASHWEQMASQGDTTIGTFDGPAAATIDAEVSERGNTYRQAAEDLREVLVTGRIPNDLMADDDEPAAARPAATTQDGGL